VSTTLATKQLQSHQLAYTQNEHKVKNHYMNVKATKQHLNKIRKKFPVQIFFPFIAGAVDTGDQPLPFSNISANFRQNSKWP
jgi:hypothetical protein